MFVPATTVKCVTNSRQQQYRFVLLPAKTPYAVAPLRAKVNAVDPIVIGSSVVSFHCVSALTVVPSVTIIIEPAFISPAASASELLAQVPFAPAPTVVTEYIPFSLPVLWPVTNTLSFKPRLTPSTTAGAPNHLMLY
jgi:hypothetical protein